MAGEGFEVEEWDADFLDELVQAEELALSSTTTIATQHHHATPLHPAPPYGNHISYSPPRELSQRVRDATTTIVTQHNHAPPLHPAPPYGNHISYSPPRESSQRVRDAPAAVFGHSHSGLTSTSLLHEQHNDEEEEIERLKRELARVSKQLILLEEECLEIKKERDKKEEQLKFVSSTAEAKDKQLCRKNSKKLHDGVGIHDHGISQEYQKENSLKELLESRVNISSKAVGIQTDKVGESDNSGSKNDLFFVHHHQNKLLDIWNPFNGQKFGRDLVLKLFSTCEVDFQVLFGHLNLSFSSKTKIDISRKSDEQLMDLPGSADAAKVSHLYFMLTKISNEMVRFEDLLEALIDLCGLNNEAIVYRSLRILRAVLKHALSMKRTFSTRDNIVVVGRLSEHTLSDKCEHQSCDNESLFYPHAKRILEQGDLQHGGNLSNARMNLFTPGPALSISGVDWSLLFEMMCKITTRHLEEHIRMEAVSIMNIIVISCNAYSEREKFASALVFQSILQLLRKEAGFPVRKQVVKLLYQLLNCPKVTAVFCSGYQGGGEDAVQAEIDTKMSSSFQEFSVIMEGLVDCIACSDNSANELKLRRSAITLVAFLASLGKTGFSIMLNHRLPESNNILACVLQSLTSDVEFDALDSAPSFDVFRERTLLLREALILLNRVVSHPQYSVPVLQALTSSRDMASLTVDIAKRLSQKRKCLWQDDTVTKQIRESEITELARVFKRRVFAFLGDSVS